MRDELEASIAEAEKKVEQLGMALDFGAHIERSEVGRQRGKRRIVVALDIHFDVVGLAIRLHNFQ